MRIPLKVFAALVRSKNSGRTGIRFLLWRTLLFVLFYLLSDVFFDGNEKLVIRSDPNNPDEPSKKFKV